MRSRAVVIPAHTSGAPRIGQWFYFTYPSKGCENYRTSSRVQALRIGKHGIKVRFEDGETRWLSTQLIQDGTYKLEPFGWALRSAMKLPKGER